MEKREREFLNKEEEKGKKLKDALVISNQIKLERRLFFLSFSLAVRASIFFLLMEKGKMFVVNALLLHATTKPLDVVADGHYVFFCFLYFSFHFFGFHINLNRKTHTHIPSSRSL